MSVGLRCRIALETGEGLYMGMIGGVKSKGVKQRVHPVKIIGDHVYVKVLTTHATANGTA
jgi:hypothetical protein